MGTRWVLSVGVAGMAVGCLFPSFDDVRHKSADDTGSSTSSSSSSSSSGTSTQAGTIESQMLCGDDDDACAVPSHFCCNNNKLVDITPDCVAIGSESTCTNSDNSQGFVMRCDGNEDCATGFFCCFTEGVGSSCQATCTPGELLCNAKGSPCFEATTCTGPNKGGVKTCK